MKLYAIFSAISLIIVLSVMGLQEESIINLNYELYFKIKLGLTLNYAFWSILFIASIILDILKIIIDIKNLTK